MKLTKSILRNLIKEELVAVKGGGGSMRLDQIQTDLRYKLEDLLARADAGEYYTIGKNELDVLANMWLTVSETMPREQNEAYGGALGPFPDRYGDAHKISPRRGHPMYKTDDELREIGADIGNILELTEKVISNLSEMQARYGEMAHMGAYARMADNAAQKLSEKYRDALDSLSRSKQLGEKKLTKPEKKEKERIVKGMKKDKKGFKKRYGDDAESVMYATATKQAKKRK